MNNDIRRRVEEIQNETLEEEQTRELNDNINKLLCERKHWRRRITQLGGSDGINEDEDILRRKKFKRKNKRKRRGTCLCGDSVGTPSGLRRRRRVLLVRASCCSLIHRAARAMSNGSEAAG